MQFFFYYVSIFAHIFLYCYQITTIHFHEKLRFLILFSLHVQDLLIPRNNKYPNKKNLFLEKMITKI